MRNTVRLKIYEPPSRNEPELFGRYGSCSVEAEDVAQLPLWLSEEEAETLTLLCATAASETSGEERLLHKLGDLLRAFRR
jgi:hypothetical protein